MTAFTATLGAEAFEGLDALDAWDASTTDNIVRATANTTYQRWMTAFDEGHLGSFQGDYAGLFEAGATQIATAKSAYVANRIAYMTGQVQPLTFPAESHVAELLTEGRWQATAGYKRFNELVAQGYEAKVAADIAGRVLGGIVMNDLHTVSRNAAAHAVDRTGEPIRGWRKVPTPGACGWCVVVADRRIYRRAETVPRHDHCRCSFAPVMPDEFVPSLLRKGGWEEEITRRADPAHATIKRADEQPHMAAEVKAVEVRGQEAVNWVAKQDATTGYTPQDYDVLNDYWGPNYKVVNASLRGLSPRDSIETFQGEVLIDQWKWRMNDIINKSAPVPDDIRAYRGAGKGVSAAFDRGDFKPGYRIVDQGFMSVTVDEGVAGFFATGHGKGDPTDGIIFEFVVPKGAKAAYNKSWVAEMTFDRGTAIEVLEAYVDDSPEAVALFGGPIRRVKGVLIPNDPSAAF